METNTKHEMIHGFEKKLDKFGIDNPGLTGDQLYFASIAASGFKDTLGGIGKGDIIYGLKAWVLIERIHDLEKGIEKRENEKSEWYKIYCKTKEELEASVEKERRLKMIEEETWNDYTNMKYQINTLSFWERLKFLFIGNIFTATSISKKVTTN